MSSLPRPPPSASILDAAVASPSLSTTILLALATALVLPLLLVALGASISALWKAIKAELAPVQAPAPRRKKSSKPPRATTAAAAAEAPPLPLAEKQASPPSLEPEQKPAAAAPVAAVHPAQAVMRALNDPTLQVRVSGLLTRNPPGGGALFRGELMDGSAVAVFAARRPMREVGGASTSSSSASASNGPSSSLTQSFSIPPLLGAGAAHPNVAQLFAVRETVVPGGCNAASGALLPPARRGCWGAGGGSVRGGTAAAGALSASSSSSGGGPLSLATALAAAGAPLPDTCSSKTPPVPEIETVAIYEFCERGTLRDAIRAWAATAAAAKSSLGVGSVGACAAAAAGASTSVSSSRLTPFDPSISPAPPPDDAHLRVKTLLEVARGLARVHRAGGRPHGALCAENVVLAASDANRRGFVAKLAAFSRPPSAGVGAGVGAWGAAPPGLAPELVEAARGGALGGAGASTMSASELRRRRRLASTSSAEDIDEEVEFSAPLPPWAAPLGGGPEMSGRAASSSSSSSSLAPPPPPPAATFEADVYAFGVLAWEVAASADAGLLPPPLPTATSSSSSARNAAEEEALLASWPCCRALGSLATQCLSPQPRARPSVAQLLRSLAALEERLRADTARSELDYLFAAVNARQAPVSSSSSSALAATAPAFEPRVVRAAAPVAAAVAAAAAAAAAPSSCGGTKGGGGEIEGAEEEEGNGQAAAQSAPRPAAAAAASSSRPFTEDIFFGMPSPPM